MASQFEEAPPLPSEPTDIDIPSSDQPSDFPSTLASSHPDPALPPPDSNAAPLPPPPKFPSLTDVSLTSATDAAAALPETPVETPDPVDPVDPANTSFVTTDPTVSSPLPVAPPPDSVGDTSHPLPADPETPDHTDLHADIDEAIRRDAVVPGSGARRVDEVGQAHWTEDDQEKLDRLLHEGRVAYVPPDAGDDDLNPAAGYTYVPAPESSQGWMKVVATQTDPQARALPVPVPVPSSAPTQPSESTDRTMPAEDDAQPARTTQPGQAVQPVPSADVGSTDVATRLSNADLSRSIFGGTFYTVPVKSRKNSAAGKELIADAADPSDSMVKQVTLLPPDSAGKVEVSNEYGLRGGHTGIVHDADFIHGDKIVVTCGNDGKVCIWDKSNRVVFLEFVPYAGEPVTMVYSLTDDDDESLITLMTLSETRLLRIWIVDDEQAIMLRSSQIQQCEGDLYMSVPTISKELKARAIAATKAAAITTSDAPTQSIMSGTAEDDDPDDQATPTDARTAPPVEDEEGKKKFSLTKVLSFGRGNSRKAVTS